MAARKKPFACQGCGACCVQPGYVFVTLAEAEAIARFLGKDPESYHRKHVTQAEGQYALRTPYKKGCIYIKDGRCLIYPVRPEQCRSFPYWDDVIKTDDGWRDISKYCPGAAQYSGQ